MICTAEGVWTFGHGNFGQLGHGGYADESLPRMVEGLVGVKVAQVAAGLNHTVICTAEGRVLTFGKGENGKLGHGGYADESLPRMVEGLVGVEVAQVSAGNSHTVISTVEGRVWTFGLEEYGKLGHGGDAYDMDEAHDVNEELVPRMVEGLVDVKVAKVAAGDHHTVICTTEGRVLAFGAKVDRSLWPKLIPYVGCSEFWSDDTEIYTDDEDEENNEDEDADDDP